MWHVTCGIMWMLWHDVTCNTWQYLRCDHPHGSHKQDRHDIDDKLVPSLYRARHKLIWACNKLCKLGDVTNTTLGQARRARDKLVRRAWTLMDKLVPSLLGLTNLVKLAPLPPEQPSLEQAHRTDCCSSHVFRYVYCSRHSTLKNEWQIKQFENAFHYLWQNRVIP